MDQPGLTHLSLSVSDLPGVLAMVAGFGGSVVEATVSQQVGDDPRPGRATAGTAVRRLARGPAAENLRPKTKDQRPKT